MITAKRVDRAAAEAKAAKGVGGGHHAGEPLGPLRHQDRRPAAQRPGQAGGAGGRRRRGLVRRRRWAWSPRAPRPTPGSSTPTGALRTRDTNANILRGVTRHSLIDLAARRGLKVDERPFTVDEAKAAHGGLHHPASAFVMPVVAIDGEPVGDGKPGPVATRLRASISSSAGATRRLRRMPRLRRPQSAA